MVEVMFVVRPIYHGISLASSYCGTLKEALGRRDELKKQYKMVELLKVTECVEENVVVSRKVEQVK